MKLNKKLIEALRELEKEKGVKMDTIIDALKGALSAAYKKIYEADYKYRIDLNENHAARVVGDVEAGDTQSAARSRDGHEGIEHSRRTFHHGVFPVAARLEANAVHRAIDLRDADDLGDLVAE